MTSGWIRRRLAIVSLVFFAAALAQPHAIGQCHYYPRLVNGVPVVHHIKWLTGIDVLLSGWLAVLSLQFAWFANVSLVIGNWRLWRGTLSPTLLVVTGLLTLSAFLPIHYLADEGGGEFMICAPGRGFGFWFWVSGNALVTVGLGWLQFSHRHDQYGNGN